MSKNKETQCPYPSLSVEVCDLLDRNSEHCVDSCTTMHCCVGVGKDPWVLI
jgi:hypothetical protein